MAAPNEINRELIIDASWRNRAPAPEVPVPDYIAESPDGTTCCLRRNA